MSDSDVGPDADFVDAVHAAAGGKKDKLAKILRSLEAPEFQLLADYFDGTLAIQKGKGKSIGLTPDEIGYRRWALERLRTLKKWWKRRKRTDKTHIDAVRHVSKNLNIKVAELENWYRHPKRYCADLPPGYKCYRHLSRDGSGHVIYVIRRPSLTSEERNRRISFR
jgi:hypothetical protein